MTQDTEAERITPDRLRDQLVMSMFVEKSDLYREQERQRSAAADEIEALAAERDALRGALVDLADRERTCEANMAFRRKQGWYRDSYVENRDFSVEATWNEVAKIARAALTREAKP